MSEHGCCGPSRAALGALGPGPEERPPALPAAAATAVSAPVVALPGGEFRMGTDDPEGFPADGEGPVRPVRLRPFGIDTRAVSNAQYAAFVDATGYRTESEVLGWSFVFAGFLPAALRRDAPRVQGTPWWCGVRGASWLAPEGPGSDLEERADHPVVHVSWSDAQAYCDWAGSRLPTEAEWEYAARGGLDQARFAWGDELTPDGRHMCNIWQGTFPTKNTRDDGYAGTAPVDAYDPNGFGLHGVAGNVWEWCADWWTSSHPAGLQVDPTGPASGDAKVMRGGSYLCHASYCNRYRVGARTSNPVDAASGNLGFRTASDL